MKKFNWRPVAVVAALAVILAAGVWYVNGVYIPNKKEALANEVLGENNAQIGQPAQDAQQSEESTYDYTIDPDELVTVDIGEVLGNESSVTVSTDENGDVWIDRDWVVDTTDYDKSDREPGEEIAAGNMASGGNTESITDEDGVYHGEQPSGSSTGNGSSSSSDNGSNGGGSSSDTNGEDAPSGSTESGDANSDNGSSDTGDGSGNSGSSGSSDNSGSSSSGGGSSSDSTPKNGDTRVVDGVEQIYINGFGWISSGGGSQSIPIEVNTSGETCSNANFG